MDLLYFRPNAPLSSLFNDLPMEAININDEEIVETITDYHGNCLLIRNNTLAEAFTPCFKTLIMAFDEVPQYIDLEPADGSWEAICLWFKAVLENRGWILMEEPLTPLGKFVTVNGRQLMFQVKVDNKC